MEKFKNKNDKSSKSELADLECKLAESYSKEYYEKIKERVADIECEDGGIPPSKIWELKKNIFPKSREPPTAMKDPNTGNILTSE